MQRDENKNLKEKLTRRRFLRLAGGSILSLSLPFVGSVRGQSSPAKVNLGGIFSLTGPNAPVGRLIKKSALLALERVNSEGGIAGELKLNLVIKDGKTSQQGASEAARRLANRGDISFALGPLIGTHGLASQPILGAAGIPQIFFGTVAGFTEQHNQYPLSVRYGTQQVLQIAPVLKYALEERNDKKIFLLVPNNNQGKGYKRIVESKLAKLPGGELVGTKFYTPFSQDFSTLMTKVLNSPADGVMVGTGIPADLISVVRELDRRGIDMDDFGYYTGQTPNGSSDFEKQVVDKGIGNGVIYAVHYDNGQYAREFSGDQPPSQAIEMEDAFRQNFGAPPISPPSASWGWGSINIIKQAIEGMIENQDKKAVMGLDYARELPKEVISYLLPPEDSTAAGPIMETPYGNYGFLSCGQFNTRLGVGTFRENKRYLLKERGYGEELIRDLCS
ncbi:MAG: ABC transporter substrate-binding protein [Candidatus Bipolaricaulota bacterium]